MEKATSSLICTTPFKRPGQTEKKETAMADDPKRYSNTRLLSQPDKKGEGGVAASVRNVWKEEKGGEARDEGKTK